MAKSTESYLLIDDDGTEHGLLSSADIFRMCQARLIAKKAQLSKKGIFASYRPISEFCEFAPYLSATTLDSDSKKEAKRLYDAEHNPPSDAEMYLHVGEQKLGPYTSQQVRTMWANGKLPSDTLFHYDAVGDWKPAKSFCHAATSRRWDYKTIVTDISFFGSNADPDKINPGLQNYGSEGWELVAVCPITSTQMTNTRTHEIVLIFKRQA